MPIFTFMLQKGVLVSRSLACYLKNEKYPRTPSDLISTVQKVKFPIKDFFNKLGFIGIHVIIRIK